MGLLSRISDAEMAAPGTNQQARSFARWYPWWASKADIGLLLLVLTAFVVALWSLYPRGDIRQRNLEAFASGGADWLQPRSVSDAYPLPISPQQWSFDFEGILTQLQTLTVDESGDLHLDSRAATVLEQASLQLGAQAPEASLERASLLIRKSFPEESGDQLAHLFERYVQFEGAKAQLAAAVSEQHGRGSTRAAAVLLEGSIDLQRDHFGEDAADALYGRQNALADYLLRRRQIREDASLSESDKRTQLAELASRYRDNSMP